MQGRNGRSSIEYLKLLLLILIRALNPDERLKVDHVARLQVAHGLDMKASEDVLRVGEVLWPGQYKPH